MATAKAKLNVLRQAAVRNQPRDDHGRFATKQGGGPKATFDLKGKELVSPKTGKKFPLTPQQLQRLKQRAKDRQVEVSKEELKAVQAGKPLPRAKVLTKLIERGPKSDFQVKGKQLVSPKTGKTFDIPADWADHVKRRTKDGTATLTKDEFTMIAKGQKYPRIKAKKHEIGGVPDFATTAQAKQWAEQRHPHIRWEIDDLDAANSTAVVRQFHRLAQDFPAIAGRLKGIGNPKRFKEIANNPQYKHFVSAFDDSPDSLACATADSRYMGLNPEEFKSHANLQQSMRLAESAKWSFKGSSVDGAGALVSHEFGHLAWGYLTERQWKLNEEGTALSRFDRAMIEQDKPKYTTDMEEVALAWRDNNKATAALSHYATVNDDEGFAEGFAALYHAPAEHQTDYTRSLKKLLDFANSPAPETESEFLRKIKEMGIRDWGETIPGMDKTLSGMGLDPARHDDLDLSLMIDDDDISFLMGDDDDIRFRHRRKRRR